MTIRELKALYDRGKRYVLAVCCLYVFVGLLLEHLLPKDSVIAAGAIGILIALELLISIDDSVKSLQLPPVLYRSQREVVGTLISLMQESGKADHTLKIIAASGGSITNFVLPDILEADVGEIRVELQLVDAVTCRGTQLPPHWAVEVGLSIDYLTRLRHHPHLTYATCRKYAHVPCLRGIMLDDTHLFLGGYFWEQEAGGEHLSGAKEPHHYYRRHGKHEAHFKLFESWFDHTERNNIDVLHP
jgi:hypothetical protein